MDIKDNRFLLLPRSAGLRLCLETLDTSVEYLYDLTVGYEGIGPTEIPEDKYTIRSIFGLGGAYPKHVHIYLRRFKIADLPVHDENLFAQWVFDRYVEKDGLLAHFYERGCFPGEKDAILPIRVKENRYSWAYNYLSLLPFALLIGLGYRNNSSRSRKQYQTARYDLLQSYSRFSGSASILSSASDNANDESPLRLRQPMKSKPMFLGSSPLDLICLEEEKSFFSPYPPHRRIYIYKGLLPLLLVFPSSLLPYLPAPQMSIPTPRVPTPQGGASLMVAYQCAKKKALVIGTSSVAASRVLALLEADAAVSIIGPRADMCTELLYRIQEQQVSWQGDRLLDPDTLLNYDLAFVCLPSSDAEAAAAIASACRQARVPVNVADRNDLCDFFMTSTYRDQSLQIAVSTNGLASKLSNRIRRHIASALPAHLGTAVRRVGLLRHKIRQSDPAASASGRRMKWLAQICEYWSMDRLAQLTDRDMEDLLEAYHDDEGYESLEKAERMLSKPQQQHHHLQPMSNGRRGTITLVGAGPGDPDLLTTAALKAIRAADLVLADKIVPAEVIGLVECELKIARKFPGNADQAQVELNAIAAEALEAGKKVVRLKQGDPFLFGRGGEEVLFFRSIGYEPKVIPGISSSVAAPLLAGVPLTHRSVASQFLVTTGTGMKNSAAPLPVFDPHRTDVFLMAIHRLGPLTKSLVDTQQYPPNLPCAIVERASCPDQRIIWGTLDTIVDVLDSCGGSRPPGLLIVGHAIHVLKQNDDRSLAAAAGGVANSFLASSPIAATQGINHLLPLHDPESVC
ncbi:hypothetical protein BX666DRAFT_270188 [Dichotomocladium elegans]|nr:hypothetical protein BX666DRAFT_270188 [Dichotomocladium elegans]